MKVDVQNAIKALVGGKAQASDLSVLMSNGLTLPAITGCAAQFAKLANGQMLSHAEIADLTAKGANVEQFLGLKPKAAPVPATPAANPENVAVVPVGPKVNIVPNVTIQQTAQVEGDPFAFILKVETTETEQGKALRSLYNSIGVPPANEGRGGLPQGPRRRRRQDRDEAGVRGHEGHAHRDRARQDARRRPLQEGLQDVP
jgi:hypothetical protein